MKINLHYRLICLQMGTLPGCPFLINHASTGGLIRSLGVQTYNYFMPFHHRIQDQTSGRGFRITTKAYPQIKAGEKSLFPPYQGVIEPIIG